jgi:hypothetical protein
MSIDVQAGTGITFERFWRWLQSHRNCILRAGGLDAYLYDHDELHWNLEEDAQKNPVVQLCRAKEVLGELLLDVRDVLFVQYLPEQDSEAGHFLFELVGQPQGEPVSLYHFLLEHGFSDEGEHRPALKH